MALELLRENRTLEPQRGLVAASVGSLSVRFDTTQSHVTRVIPRSVSILFARYGGVVRGITGIRSYEMYRA